MTKKYFRTRYWKWYVVYTGEKRATCRILVGNMVKRDNLEDVSVNVRIILKWIFKKWNGAGPILMWVRMGQKVMSLECGNKALGFIKCGLFVDYLRTCKLLKKDSAPRS